MHHAWQLGESDAELQSVKTSEVVVVAGQSITHLPDLIIHVTAIIYDYVLWQQGQDNPTVTCVPLTTLVT